MSTHWNAPTMHYSVAWFANLKIIAKISVGYGVLLVILTVTSAAAYQALGTISSQFHDYTDHVTAAGTVRDIDLNFNKLRRLVREFALTGDDTAMPTIVKAKKALQENIDLGLATSKVPVQLAKLKKIKESAGHDESNIQKLTAMNRERNELITQLLDPTGAALLKDHESLRTSAASETAGSNSVLLAADALQQALAAQLNVNKALGRYDDSAATEASMSLFDLDGTLTTLSPQMTSSEAQALISRIASESRTYADAFAQVK
jgi:CHASE3 domain sensor protein